MAGAVLASGLIFGTAFRSNAAMPASGFYNSAGLCRRIE